MKRAVFILALLAGAQEARAEGFWRRVAQVMPTVQVDSPAARQLGFSLRGHNMVVTNGTPFFCRIIVSGKEVARLGPGDAGYDNRRWESHYPQIPVLALCYEDAEYRQYVGAAGRQFYLTSGWQYSQAWTIQAGELRSPDRRTLAGRGARPPTELKSRRIKFPCEWWGASTGVQVVNNTMFVMHVRVNGQPRHSARPTEVYYLNLRNLGDWGAYVTVQLVFTDGDRLVGTYDYQVSVPSDGVWAYQLIVGRGDIRPAR